MKENSNTKMILTNKEKNFKTTTKLQSYTK